MADATAAERDAVVVVDPDEVCSTREDGDRDALTTGVVVSVADRPEKSKRGGAVGGGSSSEEVVVEEEDGEVTISVTN